MSRPRLVATRSTGGRRGSLRRVRPALVAAVAILSTLSGWPVASADAHYIFTCPGYQYLGGGRYQVPEDCSGGDPDAVVPPSSCGPEPTRTIEFNSNGTVRTLRPGTSGTVRVSSDDGSPSCGVVFQAATARVRIGPFVYE